MFALMWRAPLIFWIMTGLVTAASAAEPSELAQTLPRGQVFWGRHVISVVGNGPPSLKSTGAAAARVNAERAARLAVQNQLLEVLTGLNLDANTTVMNAVNKSSELKMRLEDYTKQYVVTDTRYYTDGGVDMLAELSFDAVLADFWMPPAAPAAATPAKPADAGPQLPGLVVNARGLAVNPAFSPRLLGDTGTELYSAATVIRSVLRQHGAVSYNRGLDVSLKNARVADKPTVVRALGVRNGTDLILGADDAAKVAAMADTLRQGRVIVVVD